MPNLRRDSKNLGEGLATESAVLREILFIFKLLACKLILLKNILGEPQTQLPILFRELLTLLPIILGDSKYLQEIFTP
jgi:hypothetical protein